MPASCCGSRFSARQTLAAIKELSGVGKAVGLSDVAVKGRQVLINQAKSEGIAIGEVQLLSDLMGGKGDFAILSATPNATNQHTWIKIMEEELKKPAYNMKLVKIAHSNDEDQKSFTEMQGLLQAYPNLKGVTPPTTVGVAARYLSISPEKQGDADRPGHAQPDAGLDQGRHRDRLPALESGDLGYFAAYAAAALASNKITGKEGETFTAGKLGKYTIGNNGEVVLGPPTSFDKSNIDKSNIDKFNF